MTQSLLGVGIYTIPEASRLTKVPADSIRRWLWGYRSRARSGATHTRPPLWTPQIPTVDASRALGFRDLIEIQFVFHFKQQGISLQSIRKTIGLATQLVEQTYPLSSIKFKTDGKRILAEVLDEQERRLVFDLYSGQYLFSFMWDKLFDALEYSKYEELLRWWPLGRKRRVVVDPHRSFGQPICPEGVPTLILANALRAEKSVDSVSSWFKVQPDSVRDAAEYESALRAA